MDKPADRTSADQGLRKATLETTTPTTSIKTSDKQRAQMGDTSRVESIMVSKI